MMDRPTMLTRRGALLLLGATLATACSDEPDPSVQISVPGESTSVAGRLAGAATPVATPTATPLPASTPTPQPSPTPRPPLSLLKENQLVVYYGNPLSPIMGILGEFDDDEELVRRLRDQATKYQALNPGKKVVPALELVYAVAQADAGRDGLYLYHMPDETVQRYIDLTKKHNMLFIIDLQNGRADPVAEAARVQEWMRLEHVHLAVDPEFTMKPGERPGIELGAMDGETVNRIQDLLQRTAVEAGVSNKILIVHQFQYSMLTNKEAIVDRDRVDVVIDLDGWGPPWSKLEKWEAIAVNQPAEHLGIKLFYRWDKPMMTEAEVQALVPRPNVIIYQ